MKKFLTLGLAALLVLTLDSCKKKDGGQFAGMDGDYVSGTPLPERLEGSNFFSGNVARGQFPPVQFGYDSSSVSDGELMKVEQVAMAMKSKKDTIIIAGFTDERGTEEYNRALGERRALAIRAQLIKSGIAPNRVTTTSFGEDKPTALGHDDAAWAKNRRGELILLKP